MYTPKSCHTVCLIFGSETENQTNVDPFICIQFFFRPQSSASSYRNPHPPPSKPPSVMGSVNNGYTGHRAPSVVGSVVNGGGQRAPSAAGSVSNKPGGQRPGSRATSVAGSDTGYRQGGQVMKFIFIY